MTTEAKVLPFVVPHYVLLDQGEARPEAGPIQPVVRSIKTLPPATLAALCDDFRRGVFLLAGCVDPATRGGSHGR